MLRSLVGSEMCIRDRLYSASVGGGAPMVETARTARSAGPANNLKAILNGTVNYILSSVATGASFDAAVRAAQDAGFAEPDPTADLSGDDARAKLSILSYEIFGEEIALSAVTCEALSEQKAQAFSQTDGVWKQIARLNRDQEGTITASVGFEDVSNDSEFAGIQGEGNALRIENTDGKLFFCQGLGAGRAPTVDSLFADLYTLQG